MSLLKVVFKYMRQSLTHSSVLLFSLGIVSFVEFTTTTLLSNNITNNIVGIEIYNSNNNTIKENNITENLCSINIMDSNYINIMNNQVAGYKSWREFNVYHSSFNTKNIDHIRKKLK